MGKKIRAVAAAAIFSVAQPAITHEPPNAAQTPPAATQKATNDTHARPVKETASPAPAKETVSKVNKSVDARKWFEQTLDGFDEHYNIKNKQREEENLNRKMRREQTRLGKKNGRSNEEAMASGKPRRVKNTGQSKSKTGGSQKALEARNKRTHHYSRNPNGRSAAQPRLDKGGSAAQPRLDKGGSATQLRLDKGPLKINNRQTHDK